MERPILFSAPMVRALLDGSKTQTRRICKPAAALSAVVGPFDCPEFGPGKFGDEEGDVQFHCPYGRVGDRLWVRETSWIAAGATDLGGVVHCADKEGFHLGFRKTPSIHMPRWASRIDLEITGVRVERLHDITDGDIEAEGIDMDALYDAQEHYDIIAKGDECWTGRPTLQSQWQALWETINGVESWAANPWVWVVEFKRVTP